MYNKTRLKPDITVIIPCYNSGFNILRTLNSLKSQTYKNFEIIIVNDGSQDPTTIKILKNIKKNNVKIINQKNKGLAAARNNGILKSKTEFILPLDSDDWLASNALEEFIFFLKKNKQFDFVYSNIVNQNQSTGVLKKNYNFFEQLFSNQMPYCLLIRKSVLTSIGLYDENMKNGFEDWELNIRMGKHNYIGHCLNKNLFFYNVSEEGMLKSVSVKNFASIYKYIRFKHKEIYTIGGLLKFYSKYWNKKSSYILIFYFLYNYFYYTSSSKFFNKVLGYFIKNYSKTSQISKLNKRELINKKFKVKKIVHVITSLDVGGAEKALVSLLEELKKNKKNFIPSVVICLKDKGYYHDKITKLNIKVYCLNMKPNKINLFKQYNLFKIFKKEKPDIVQTWMYHSDIVGGIAAFFANVKTTIWTIHNFNLSIKALGIQTRFVVLLCTLFSHFLPSNIISVSKAAIKNHTNVGYNKKKFVHIPLGYNKKLDLRIENKIKNSKSKKIVFGSLSRWNIQKNHKFMLESFGKLKKTSNINFKILLAGKGLNSKNKELVKLIKLNKLSKNVILLDFIEDTTTFFSKIDVHILTSIGEAFPNVICESMLNKVPCISSNVGDIANILGSTGWIFEVNNSKNLMDIFTSVYEEKNNHQLWSIRKNLSRKRIVDNFGLDLMMQNYYQVWKPSVKDGVMYN